MPTGFTPILYIGNRNYSSWSLRAWLCLKWAGIDFEERLIELDQDGYGEGRIADLLAVTPAGKVPALTLGSEMIWDSIAIAEWAAENAGGVCLMPPNTLDRARLRSTVGEMHAGFSAVRQELPMNILRRCVASGYSVAAKREIARIDALWQSYLARVGNDGGYLMGMRTIADAFYTPVATRFRTYNIPLSARAQQYADLLLADVAFREWEANAAADGLKPFSRAHIDGLYLRATT